MAAQLGVDPDRLELEHVGLNHLSWITAARVDGVDRLPELLARHGGDIARDLGLPEPVIRELGAVPSYYLRYFYTFDDVLAEQNGGHHRAEEVMVIERRLLEMYADPELDRKPDLLANRGGAYCSEAAAQLLASLHDGAGDVQVVDVRNGDAMSELDADDVVEVPSRIDRDGAHPIRQPAMPPATRDLVRAVKAYERLAIDAAESGERADVKAALEAHPLVGGRIGDVEPLLDALLDANRPYLPQFDGVT
jgi:6-phospho-beta-glucosidase